MSIPLDYLLDPPAMDLDQAIEQAARFNREAEMGRWNAESDIDYLESLRGRVDVQRTCTGCGEALWVSLDEPYLVQVFCETCQNKPVAVALKRASGE